jgi:hypothetical protein
MSRAGSHTSIEKSLTAVLNAGVAVVCSNSQGEGENSSRDDELHFVCGVKIKISIYSRFS